VFLAGGLFLNLSFFTGGNIFDGKLGAPDGGWFRLRAADAERLLER
jgi:hypothetical protein